jgi:hypothetical protein
MAAEEQKHSSIKEEVTVLDKKYQKTKKEYEVCIYIAGFSNKRTLIRTRYKSWQRKRRVLSTVNWPSLSVTTCSYKSVKSI